MFSWYEHTFKLLKLDTTVSIRHVKHIPSISMCVFFLSDHLGKTFNCHLTSNIVSQNSMANTKKTRITSSWVDFRIISKNLCRAPASTKQLNVMHIKPNHVFTENKCTLSTAYILRSHRYKKEWEKNALCLVINALG